AIGDRLLDQAAGAVEEAVVDAPGVDADRSDARAAARGERLRDLAQRRDDLGEEVARAPAQGRRPALVRRLDPVVPEAAHLLELELVGAEAAAHDAAVARAEVDRDEALLDGLHGPGAATGREFMRPPVGGSRESVSPGPNDRSEQVEDLREGVDLRAVVGVD